MKHTCSFPPVWHWFLMLIPVLESSSSSWLWTFLLCGWNWAWNMKTRYERQHSMKQRYWILSVTAIICTSSKKKKILILVWNLRVQQIFDTSKYFLVSLYGSVFRNCIPVPLLATRKTEIPWGNPLVWIVSQYTPLNFSIIQWSQLHRLPSKKALEKGQFLTDTQNLL